MRCGLIVGKALSLYDDQFATMTQSFGPEARGSACSSQLVVSKDEVLYPYVTQPDILVSMSQDAYDKYIGGLRDKGVLIIDEDLVRLDQRAKAFSRHQIPATRLAEELGNRIIANLVMIGFFTAVTGMVSPEAVKQALPGLVPDRSLDINLRAFEQGYQFGLKQVEMQTCAAT